MRVFCPGGAGYVGSVLVPKLLERGHEVVVYDLYIYGRTLQPHPRLTEIVGDVRDATAFRAAVEGCDAVIHLACISNDPSCELDPELARSINYVSFQPQIKACNQAGIKLFVYASSASVYGISDAPDVTEDHPLRPVSDYNRYKKICEDLLRNSAQFDYVIVRPATICGYSPRLRLDLVVNMLAAQAYYRCWITVLGGNQYRPIIHVEDIANLYCYLLDTSPTKISGQVFNASLKNIRVADLSLLIKDQMDDSTKDDIVIKFEPSNDVRSYRVSANKLRALGFRPIYDLHDALADLHDAFAYGKIGPDITSSKYVNIARMKEINLK
jgi:nucleoside-diphosphate-sugar epimerase